MIPRVFHQIWVGSAPFPAEFAEYQKTWRRHHPEWELKLWTDDSLPSGLRRPEVYELDRIAAERSDILRLELLWKFGGVYIDTDMECLRPIDALIDGVTLFAVDIKPGRVTNTVIGAVPEHPLFDRALNELRPQKAGEQFDKTASGPLFLDGLFKSFKDVTSFAPETFFPGTEAERKDAYAIHHSARSWKDLEGWRDSALRAEERLAKSKRQLDEERAAHEKTKATVKELKEEMSALKTRVKEAEKAEKKRGATFLGRRD
jgi:inositol phosphorylceramide mannosyltransferase catalytic subunit